MVGMDRELRDWLKSLSAPTLTKDRSDEFSAEGAEYLARIATDGTLRAALNEIAATDHDLAD